MANDPYQRTRSDKQAPDKPIGRGALVVRFILVLVILTIGVTVWLLLKNATPKTKRRPPVKPVPLVQIEHLQPRDVHVTVEAMGTVVPARSVVIKSRVAGEVIALHPDFSPGAVVKKNTLLMEIDPREYELALKQQQSAVADAEYALKLEQGHQQVAQREWDLLGSKSSRGQDTELALRKPHLAKAEADLAAAKAALEKAALDLARTRIEAPFNAIVQTKTVEVGSQIAAQEVLAELVGTDAFWIEASIPLDRLDWISIPRYPGQEGAPVRVGYAQGHQITGTVIRLLGKLTQEGRMARVLVAVNDPLGLSDSGRERAPLLIGEYARLQIRGRRLEQVYVVPRLSLRDNGKVWLVDEANRMVGRTIAPLWRDELTVVLKNGLKTGDRLVVSDVPGAVEGMTVKPISNAEEPSMPTAAPASETGRTDS